MFGVEDLVIVRGGFSEYQRSFLNQIFRVVSFIDNPVMGRCAVLENGEDVILIRVTDLEPIFTG